MPPSLDSPQPAVTHANVGELAVDVLVASLGPQPLGALESHNVLPAVGNDAYDGSSPGADGGAGGAGPGPGSQQQAGVLLTALELFALKGGSAAKACSRDHPSIVRSDETPLDGTASPAASPYVPRLK